MKSLASLFLLFCIFPFAISKEVKGMFVFGSSLVDNGNNNYIKDATAKADFPPYGIDFPSGPSGRFSNGKNLIDVLGELLELPGFIPPFKDPRTRGERIVHGVNYASGGSGILEQTGSIDGEVMSMGQQIREFETKTLPELRDEVDINQTRATFEDHISKYLFVVGTGGNDYLLNYFISKDNNVTLQVFTSSLIQKLSCHLKRLYNLGARKFVLFSIQAMGCYPVVRENLQATNGTCVDFINEAALLFNSRLESLANDSKAQLPGSNMVFINSYKMITDIINDPINNGFQDTSRACCEVSSDLRSAGHGILCKRGGRACDDRSGHVFFDGLHPTEAVNVRIANKAYGTELEDEAYPTNIKELLAT